MENTKFYILEREVDKEIFDQYKNRRYEIGGVQRNLLGVQVWATSQELAEACPDEAAQARAIRDQILSEISAKPQTKRGKTFHSFLEGLQTIYREELANYNAVQNAFATAEKDYNATMADPNAPEHIKLIARGDLERARQTFEQNRLKAQDSYNARVKELRQQMAEFTADLYRATPDRIDQSAMQLLNTGIMTVDEMDHLASRYRDNPPMMRIIGEYALKKSESFGPSGRDNAEKYALLGRKLSNITDNGNALAGFDQMADFGRNGLGTDAAIAKVHEKHWDRLYADACTAYDAFIVQPSGGADE